MNKSEENFDRGLSVKQQELLSRYFDGESSWLQSLNAKRVLKSNPTAAAYIESLAALRAEVSRVMTETSPEQSFQVDLWAKIESRIENEERNAIYLKNSSVNKSISKSKNRPYRVESRVENQLEISNSIGAAWSALVTKVAHGRGLGVGFGTGAVSAALLMFTILPSNILPGNNRSPTAEPARLTSFEVSTARNEAQALQLASNLSSREGSLGGLEAREVRYLPSDIQGTDFDVNARYLGTGSGIGGTVFSGSGIGSGDYRSVSSSREVQPVEIDWVRSDGRLRVMRDPQESNPVIFVAPRSHSIGVLNGGTKNGIRGGVVSRRPTRSTFAPFDDSFGIAGR